MKRDQFFRLVDLLTDPTLEQRVELLADKANDGELTEAERIEYDGYIEANNVLAALPPGVLSRIREKLRDPNI